MSCNRRLNARPGSTSLAIDEPTLFRLPPLLLRHRLVVVGGIELGAIGAAGTCAFRSLKSVDLEVRPIHHRRAQRVRAHVLLCMLAYYLEWHMCQALKSILFDDHDKVAADAARASIVAKAERYSAAERKAATKRTADGGPVHGFRSLLDDLATVTRNIMAMVQRPDATFVLYPKLTPAQDRAFQLLGVSIKM